ncbi:MAG TPA: c-type cytochrome [Bryobacteraceae bacterium]|nr:c-type cytochrome [Bryobacteraceae bacterium]
MRILIALTATLALTASFALSQEPAKKITRVSAAYTPPGSGVEMFKSYCAPCHGLDAKGTGPAASALKKAPADLTLLSQKHNGKFPRLEVQQFIKGDNSPAAHGSRDMPMWGELLRSLGTAQEPVVELRVRNLTDYVESVQAK